MEACARQAVQQTLADPLTRGPIELRVVDVQQPENEHFRNDYQLVGPAVVLVRVRGGRTVKWDNLIEVNSLLRQPPQCVLLIRRQVRAMVDQPESTRP
jgi:hypothetical protein